MSRIITLSYDDIWGDYMSDGFKNIERNTTMEEKLLKLHAMIFEKYDNQNSQTIKGIIYTEGFKEGDSGYLVSNTSGRTSKLRVSRSFKYSLMDVDNIPMPSLLSDEFIHAEYIVDNDVHVVYFHSEWHDEQIILPPHELLSIS